MLCVVLLGVDLLMLLQILRPLEWLLADFTDVRLERCVDCSGGRPLSA